jgi:hypothetical protein
MARQILMTLVLDKRSLSLTRQTRHCEAAKRPWQSIFFKLNAAKDGLFRCARNDDVKDSVRQYQERLLLNDLHDLYIDLHQPRGNTT